MSSVTQADKECGSNDGAPSQSDCQSRDPAGDADRTVVTTPPRSFLRPGIFATKANVDTSHHGGDSATKAERGAESRIRGALGEAEVEGGTVDGGKAADKEKDKEKDKEEKSFLSGFLRRLSIDPSGGDEKAGQAAAAEASASRVFSKTFPLSVTEVSAAAERDTAAVPAENGPSSSKKKAIADKLFPSPVKQFDSLPPEARDATERRRPDAPAAAEDNSGGDDGDGRGGGSGDNESLNLVLPEAVEVLMRALQRAQSPAVVSRCLLQLESAVAWLPAAPTADEDRGTAGRAGGGDGGRKDCGGGRGDEEGASRSATAKAAAGGGGSSAAGKKGTDGGDRERNADVLMSRQGWLVWCQRLVEALSARNDSGDLVPRRAAGASGYGYGGNDSMDLGGGGDRWGTGGSDASEAGGYLDDSHSGVCGFSVVCVGDTAWRCVHVPELVTNWVSKSCCGELSW